MKPSFCIPSLLVAAVLPALKAVPYTGDVTNVVDIRRLDQETPGMYAGLWQPFIARWDQNQLLVTFGGFFGGNTDMGSILCCRSPDNGATWTAPVAVFRSSASTEAGESPYAYANSVLYHPPGQDIVWCFAMRCPRYYPDSEDSRLCAAYSPDGGRSWHEVELAVNYHSPLITNAGIVAVSQAGRTRYLMAVTRNTLRHDPGGDRCELVLQSSNLIVWNLAAYIPQQEPRTVFLHEGNMAAGDRPGEVKMVMRTATYLSVHALNPPVAYSSVSRDGGRSWSLAKPEPKLYNTISKGFYGNDSLGRHIYVYNDGPAWERKALRYVVQSPTGRWSQPRTFYDTGFHNSYPTLIEDVAPGDFLCVWDSSNQSDRHRTCIRFGRLKLGNPPSAD